MALTGKERRFLRGLGHHLTPVVQVGKEGISEALIAASDKALADHELIKIKVGENAPLDRYEAAEALAEATGAEVAQVLGRTALLYRPDPDEPAIVLPKAKAASASDDGADGSKAAAPKAANPSEKHSPAPVPNRMKRRLPHRSSNKALR